MSRSVLAAVLLAVAAAAWVWLVPPALAPWPPAAARVAEVPAPAVVPTVHLPRLAAEPPAGPRAPEQGRNPFLPAAVPPRPDRAPSLDTRPVAPPEAVMPSAPAYPRLDLIGVAEAREGAGMVRIAVIAGPRGVHHARPGDLLEQVYRVERVTPTGADVRLLPEDRVVHLGLRP
ncbi:hypothetical protein TBR22_A30670 [Luteitalea sp. TBR-22]|uniref:hypothetical protein n=1 Tax=Luteitalea sp. TBR-22 TaxID=2802971 RepID=UPI001AF1CD32|nr:hypothetical protein [Luteitalea sp. TBR-22]BCS33839.1 hypothetical protein TBR22_A30670 [Luteitalea sp. TBR-22]